MCGQNLQSPHILGIELRPASNCSKQTRLMSVSKNCAYCKIGDAEASMTNIFVMLKKNKNPITKHFPSSTVHFFTNKSEGIYCWHLNDILYYYLPFRFTLIRIYSNNGQEFDLGPSLRNRTPRSVRRCCGAAGDDTHAPFNKLKFMNSVAVFAWRQNHHNTLNILWLARHTSNITDPVNPGHQPYHHTTSQTCFKCSNWIP